MPRCLSEREVFDKFLGYLDSHCSKPKTNVLFSHNLPFDLTAILSLKEEEIFRYRQPPLIKHSIGEIRIYCQKVWYAKIRLFRNNARVLVVETVFPEETAISLTE